MNQKSRQNAKNSIEKDFSKLMNNGNLGFDYRSNVTNVTFKPIIDQINEIFYIKKYYSPFDTKVSGFVNSNLLKQEIEQIFQQGLSEVKYDNKSEKRKLTKDVKTKLEDAFKNKKIKTMIDFDRK